MSLDVVTLPSFYLSTFADQMYLSWRQSLRNSQKYFRVFSRKLMTWHLRFIHLSNSVLFIYCFLLCSKESFVFLTLNQFDVTMSSIHTLCVCERERESEGERVYCSRSSRHNVIILGDTFDMLFSRTAVYTHTHTHTHSIVTLLKRRAASDFSMFSP
jgi:hypothetical protein